MTTLAPAKTIGCVESATQILGDKWTPVLLRAIHNQSQVRFCQLQDNVGGINPRTLTARLVSLEEQGIVTRCADDTTRRECYRLTEKGEALMPILRSMAQWGKDFPKQTVNTV